ESFSQPAHKEIEVEISPPLLRIRWKMVYLIGGGDRTIGGGALAKTERIPSLKLRCLDICARYLDRLGDLGYMPSEMFIDLLKRAKDKATPDLVQALQNENEHLLCEEVDVAFWKLAVESHILRRSIPAPGPVLIEQTNELKAALLQLMDSSPEQPCHRWSSESLEQIPTSVGLLRATLIGQEVSKLRKTR
ncbi:unnamed protein product, partial [Discosporangium mesarthrocarpum]